MNATSSAKELRKSSSYLVHGHSKFSSIPLTKSDSLNRAKRYERLLKAHGIQQQAAISPRDASVASTKVKKAATEGKKNPTTKATKKRKAIEAESATNNEEDDEEPSPLAKKSRVKKEIKSEVKVGEEEEGAHDPRLRFDGSFETFVDKHEQGIKNEEGVLVKEEPVDETRGGNTLATEDEEMFDRFLQPGDYDDSIVIGD